MSGLQKRARKNPIKEAILFSPPHLSGAIFVYGRIGSGKTVSLLSLAGIYHDNPLRKYKIFDLWGGDRNEHLYWTLPSNKINYWKKAEKLLRLDSPGPKQYKVKILYPYFKSTKTKKLPYNPPNVHSEYFTIPIKQVKHEDIALVIGSISESSSGRYSELKRSLKKTDTVLKTVKNYEKLGGRSDLLYKNFLEPLSKELFLQDNNCDLNLTPERIREEVADQETITILSLDGVEKEYKLFVMGYVIRLINEELDRKRTRVIGIIREASEFFRITDQTIIHERYKIFKSYMSQWIRMGRRGFHLMLDTQSPSETRGIVDGQQDLTFLGRLPGEADRSLATDQIKRDGLITRKQINQIGINEPGQFVVCPSGDPAYIKYVLLPRCRFWEEKNGNFYKSVWKQEVDRWISYSEEKQKLIQKYKDQKEDLEIERVRGDDKEKDYKDKKTNNKEPEDEMELDGPKINEVTIKKQERDVEEYEVDF